MALGKSRQSGVLPSREDEKRRFMKVVGDHKGIQPKIVMGIHLNIMYVSNVKEMSIVPSGKAILSRGA